MLTINFITNAGPKSGVGYHAAYLAAALTDQYPNELQLRRYLLDGQHRQIILNDEVIKTLVRWPGILSAKPFSWIRMGRIVKKQLQQDPETITHITNQGLSFLAGKSQRSIVTVHDLIELTDPQTPQARMVYKYLYKGIAEAQHVIAVSQYTADIVKEYFNLPSDRITVIPNGVGKEFFQVPDFSSTIAALTLRKELKIEEGQPIVLYVGSDHPRKNVAGALKAFSLLQSSLPKAVFIKIGEPGLVRGREETLKVIEELQIKDSVRILGNIPQEKLNEFFNLADVMLFPSFAEGFGLPVLQAMATGTPVVTSNISSLPEVAGDAALLVDPHNTEAIAEAVLKVIQNTTLALEMSNKGIERAKRFDWKIIAEKTYNLYTLLGS